MLPALATPFKDGKLDEIAYRRLIKYVLDNGADGVVPNGTTGENPTLFTEERQAIISIAVEVCRPLGKKVIAGAGNNNTYATIDLVNSAAANTGLPIVMYNVPSRTGVNMTTETAVELSNVERIAGLKEASGNLVQFAEISAGCAPGFIMLSGEDALTLPMLPLGCAGVITVAGNAAPKAMSDLLKYWEAGKIDKAWEVQKKMLPLSC